MDNNKVSTQFLIDAFTDMANRDTLLVNTTKEDLLSQIIGTILRVSMLENTNNANNHLYVGGKTEEKKVIKAIELE